MGLRRCPAKARVHDPLPRVRSTPGRSGWTPCVRVEFQARDGQREPCKVKVTRLGGTL